MRDLEHFKHKLMTLQKEMTERITAIDHDIKHEGMTSDWTEQATERENDEVLESLGHASEKMLLMVNAALQRIDSGEYYICVNCGHEIPSDRLELLPYTTYCVSCAESLKS